MTATLVNAALLGTDRRPPHDADVAPDPALGLLEQAVRERAGRAVAVGLEHCAEPETGPAATPPRPPVAARELLDEILTRPSAVLVSLWLRAAVAAGVGLAPEHWTPVLGLAARHADVDRDALGAALGERGQWFAAQNPAWGRARRPAPARPDAEPTGADRLFAVPDPWSAPVVRAALDLLESGTLPGRAAAAYGLRVGARLPLEAYGLVGDALARSPRSGVVAAEDVLWIRLVLAEAFDPARTLPLRRLPIR